MQNNTEPLGNPLFHFASDTNSVNISNSTIVLSESYSGPFNKSQDITIQSLDDENLSEIERADDSNFFSDEEEGNDLLETLNNNIDKSETKDCSCSDNNY